MKIHEYNEMMSYLTRPAAPTRQPVVQGGVIGQGGMFQGQDMGYRTGFAKVKALSKKDQKTFDEYKKARPNRTEQSYVSAKSRIRAGVIKPGQYISDRPPITKEQFIKEYKKFQKSKNNMGLDSEFAEYLNENYKSNKGTDFNTKNIQRQRKSYGLKTKVTSVPPSVKTRFDKIKSLLPDLISDLNSKEKFVTREQLSSMVEKKLNIPGKYDAAGYKISQLDLDNYPIVRKLHKVPDKIELVHQLLD